MCACSCLYVELRRSTNTHTYSSQYVQESWWAYEVCVGQGIRQYHEEPVSEVVDLSDEKGGELMQAAAAATATGARRSGKRGPDTAAHPGGSEGGGAGGSSSGAASGRAGTGTGAGGKPSPEASELRGVREKEKERQLSGSQGATDKSSAKKVVSLTMVSQSVAAVVLSLLSMKTLHSHMRFSVYEWMRRRFCLSFLWA